jgi:predicted permease
MLTTLLQDARLALRQLGHNRGFAAAALVTIALGVGGTSAVFSVVYGVLLRPLPYPDPDRIVSVAEAHPGATTPFTGVLFTNRTYHAWEQKRTIEAIGAYANRAATLSGGTEPERLRGTAVTPSLIRLLGIVPAAGRLFRDEDAVAGAAPVAVISHAFWRDRFGGDPAAVGRTLTLDGRATEIVGVAPAGFIFPGPRGIDIYSPLDVPRAGAGSNAVNFIRALARLKPGATPEQAAAEATAAARTAERPMAVNMLFGQGGPVEIRVVRLLDTITERIRPALLVLAGGILLVLLIACANVANLYLSRGTARSRELAVRAALGAGRRRLAGQLLTESLVISLAGGTIGAFVGWALTRAVPALAPVGFPRVDDVQVDVRFLGIALLVSLFVGVTAGLLPALRGSTAALSPALREGDTRTTAGRVRARALLLAGEAALAVVLLVGAALLGRSFVALLHVDAGYDPDNVLLATLYLGGAAAEEGRGAEAVDRILGRIRAASGVAYAGASNMAPFSGVTAVSGFSLPGRTTPEGQPVIARALSNSITPGYAEALGMRLLEGRLLTEQDRSGGIRPMLVNDAFVRTYLRDERQVIGMRFPRLFSDEGAAIVGIVADVLQGQLDAKPEPQLYLPAQRTQTIQQMTLAVKTSGDPTAFVPTLRALVGSTEPAAAVDSAGTLAARVSESVGQPRFAAAALGAFAALALALAATGLYGVLSYTVSQRRREMGVRAALGARRGQIVGLILRQGLAVTSLGLALGIAAALAATRLVEGMLFGVSRLDVASFAIGPALLLLVAVAACLVPARRAASIDPAEALRAE